MRDHQRVLVHGDFWLDNILVDDSAENLFGVIDFGDASFSDRAVDFATLDTPAWGFMRSCLKSYVEQGGTLGSWFEQRLWHLAALRAASFFSLRAALKFSDEAEIENCLAKLRTSSILTSD